MLQYNSGNLALASWRHDTLNGKSSDNKERDWKGDLTLRLSVFAIATFVIINSRFG